MKYYMMDLLHLEPGHKDDLGIVAAMAMATNSDKKSKKRN